ncbi:MAG: sodium:calcium antiporter, partial [Candidatus Aminicenantes bacterium]|nr:sodium:calcium antiporter [Candidatus Aminicenantes bacterium]
KKHSSAWLLNLGFILGGLVFLVAGSRLFVDGAVSIAEMIGVSKLVIGLTIVAAGTSLPEVATSVVASIRGHQDIAVGNVIGSNIFNILAVLGFSSLISSGGLNVAASALRFDIPVMIVVAIACLPIFFTGKVIARWEGLLFLFYYLAYVAYLIFSSAHHKALPLFSMMMVVFVIPITVLTLLITTLYSFRRDKKV